MMEDKKDIKEQMSEIGDNIEWLNLENSPRYCRMPNILYSALDNLAKSWDTSITTIVNHILCNTIDSSYIINDDYLIRLVNIVLDNYMHRYGDNTPEILQIKLDNMTRGNRYSYDNFVEFFTSVGFISKYANSLSTLFYSNKDLRRRFAVEMKTKLEEIYNVEIKLKPISTSDVSLNINGVEITISQHNK